MFSCHAQEWVELYLYSPVYLHGVKSDNFIFAFTFTFTLQELKIISSLSSPTQCTPTLVYQIIIGQPQ